MTAVLLAAAAGALLAPGPSALSRVAGPRHGAVGTATSITTRRRLLELHAARSTRKRAAVRRAELTELLGALASELRTGADPRAAVHAAAEGLTNLGVIRAAAAAPAADVPATLTALAREPGGAAARHLAVAWAVAERSGCGLAGPVSRLHAAELARERLRREVAAQLAGPRATARLLAALPLIGLAMGSGLGADPTGFLTGTPPGRVCLVTGLGLVALGVAWTRAITRSAVDLCA